MFIRVIAQDRVLTNDELNDLQDWNVENKEVVIIARPTTGYHLPSMHVHEYCAGGKWTHLEIPQKLEDVIGHFGNTIWRQNLPGAKEETEANAKA